MIKNYNPGYGYVEFTPNLNDYYDVETGEEIYIPSNYPYDIPKVYIEGCINPYDYGDMDSIITVRDNIVTKYIYYDNCGSDFYIIEYNLETLEKKEYTVTPFSSSRMNLRDYSSLVDYIDPNLIKRINNKQDIPISTN